MALCMVITCSMYIYMEYITISRLVPRIHSLCTCTYMCICSVVNAVLHTVVLLVLLLKIPSGPVGPNVTNDWRGDMCIENADQ